jgi:excisionase family DNA binding protein
MPVEYWPLQGAAPAPDASQSGPEAPESRNAGRSSTAMSEIEPFVDANRAAQFLSISRRRLLELVRAGVLPAHPLDHGRRRTYRFRLSELAAAMERNSGGATLQPAALACIPKFGVGGTKKAGDNVDGSPRSRRRKSDG